MNETQFNAQAELTESELVEQQENKELFATHMPDSEDALENIFRLLWAGTKVEFTDYKHTILKRQIMRRMALHRLERLEDYIIYLQGNSTEVEALFHDLLIHVTSFFRDPEVFEALKNYVFPNLIEKKALGEPIRIWVAGCSTGEEVYSIAICLLEFLGTQQMPTIQIFGTDISEPAIEKARLGIYIPSLVTDISPERLQRFFVKVEGGYQVSKAVRQMCVFAKQNLIADPSFSHLDLISCRNVLIYFKPLLQKKVIRLFNYSLKLTGFLLLGTSESIIDCSDLFRLVDKKQRIYSPHLRGSQFKTDFTDNYFEQRINGDNRNKVAGQRLDLLSRQADRIVCNKYSPAGVIINNDLEIIQFRGETSLYLTSPPGKASLNLLNMAEASLLLDLRAAILEAKRLDIAVIKEGIQVTNKEQFNEVNLQVIPFKIFSDEERYFLVLFEKVPKIIASPDDKVKVKPRRKQTLAEQELIELKQELAATKHELSATEGYLQSLIYDQKAVNQELRTMNEEILSSIEELQSTNEELQTAKEEIKATNEEVITINQELNSQILESNQINSDLQNLLSSVNIPIIMLGNNLSIRRFTPMAEKIFKLTRTDVGRPLNHIKSNINVPNLEQLILEVIDTLEIKQQEIQDKQGHWYDLWIRPYKTLENRIDGAVIVLLDIDARKRNAEQLKECRDYVEAIVDTGASQFGKNAHRLEAWG
ncbi:MAG: PAS domain-containing protein [Hassallia sp. WJT32-NPBG1]|jgi:two-component system CheB/CheR fusion protein|nr:PAS domain-containing protein [Hassallia sp. WJT32-NPBG1]